METAKNSNTKKIIKSITILIIITGIVYAFSGALINSLINEIIEEFHISGALEGLMATLVSFGSMVAFLISPVFQGRASKIFLIIISGIFICLALVLSGFAGTAVVFGIGCVILGLASGVMDNFTNSSLIDMYPDNSKGPMGLFHGFYGIGSLIFPVVITALLPLLIWRGMYFIVAILMFIAMAAFFFYKNKLARNGGLKETAEEKLKLRDIGLYLKNKRNIIMFLTCFLLAMSQIGICSWIVRYMTIEFNAETLGTLCITFYWICATINRFVMPLIKLDGFKLILLGAAFFAISLTVGILSGNMIVMCIMVALTGLFSGHFVPVALMIAAEGYHGSTTLTTSVMQLAFGIGRVVMPILIGLITTGTSMKFGMSLPAIATAISFFMCLYLMGRKNRTMLSD